MDFYGVLHKEMDKKNNFQIGKKSLAWGYIAQLFQYGTSVLILPLILNRMPSEEVAIWYIFLSIYSIVGLVDFGFSPSLSKQVSFVYSGVSTIQKEGVDIVKTDGRINYRLLNDIYRTCIILYRKLSIIIGASLISLGSIYLYYVIDTSFCDIAIPWILFIVSTIYNFYYNYIIVFIRGKGLIAEQNKLLIISKGFQILSLFILLLCNLGLLSLVISNFLSALLLRELGRKYVLDEEDKNALKLFNSYNDLTTQIWFNAKRYGIASLGVVMLAQSNIFLSGLYLPISQVAQLGLAIQIFSILLVLSRVMLTNYTPKFSSLFVRNDIESIKKYFIACQSVGYAVFVFFSIVIIIYGNEILTIISSKTYFPPKTVLILYSLFYLMELTHGNCAMLISTENKVPYYKAGIVSGITSIIVTFLLLYFDFGIFAFPIGLISGSLPYNSWKWPLVVYNRLKQS